MATTSKPRPHGPVWLLVRLALAVVALAPGSGRAVTTFERPDAAAWAGVAHGGLTRGEAARGAERLIAASELEQAAVPIFGGAEIANALSAMERDPVPSGFAVGPATLGLEPLRGPPVAKRGVLTLYGLALVYEARAHQDPARRETKTRIGGLELFDAGNASSVRTLSLGIAEGSGDWGWENAVGLGVWYDPETGSFVSADPLGFPDSMNQYAWGVGNYWKADPLGLAVSIARNGTIVVSDERSAQGETFRVPYSWAEEHPDELLQLLTVVGGLDRSQAGTFLAKEGLSVKGEAANQFLARQASRDTNDLIEGAKKEWINQAKWAALGFGAGKVIQAGARGLRGALSVGDDVAAAAGSGIDDLARELAPRGGLQSLPKPTVPAPLPVPATPAPKVTGEALEDLRIHFDRTTKPAYWKEYARYVDDEVISNPFGRAETNLPRMRQGLPPIGPDGRPVPLHHIRPLSRGGTNEFENLVPFNQTTHQRYTKLLHNEPFPGVLYHLMIQ